MRRSRHWTHSSRASRSPEEESEAPAVISLRNEPFVTAPTPSEDPLYAALASRAETDAARDLVTDLRKVLEAHEEATGSRVYKRQGQMLQAFDSALGAFVADLLLAFRDEDAAGWVYRSMKTQTFSGGAVS